MNVSEEATTRLPARPLRGRAPRRALRGPDHVDDRGPRPGLRARGRAARDRGRPDVGVGDLGRLRRRRGAAARRRRTGSERRRPAATRARNLHGGRNEPLRRLDRLDQGRPAPGAQLQARPAAARAVAVPARRPAVPRAAERRRSRASRASPTRTRARSTSCCSATAPDRASPTSSSRSSGAPEARGPLRRGADRGDRRPRRGVQKGGIRPPARSTARTSTRSRRSRCSSRRPGQKKGKVDDAYVETIDILPTIFDVLNLDPKVKMDGKSAFSDEVQKRDGSCAS